MAENIKADKAKSTHKINAVMATIMAFGKVVRNFGNVKSVYDDRGLLICCN